MFATVADPSIGGTYMTLLATLSNIAFLVPHLFGFILMDLIDAINITRIDPLYIQCAMCIAAAFVIVPFYDGIVSRLNEYDVEDWYINKL